MQLLLLKCPYMKDFINMKILVFRYLTVSAPLFPHLLPDFKMSKNLVPNPDPGGGLLDFLNGGAHVNQSSQIPK